MKKGNSQRQVMTISETKLLYKQEINEKICVVTKHTVTHLPYYISIVPLTSINHTESILINTLIEIEGNPFFSLEQPNIIIMPTLQELDSRTPDKFITILWNPDDCSMHIKKNMTIGYVKESENIKKAQTDQQESIREVSEISQE